MFWEAEQYEQVYRNVVAMLNTWDEELKQVEALIEERKASNQDYKFLLINLEKANKKYDLIIELLGHSNQLFKAMQKEMEALQKFRIKANDLQQQLNNLTGYRTRIMDML